MSKRTTKRKPTQKQIEASMQRLIAMFERAGKSIGRLEVQPQTK